MSVLITGVEIENFRSIRRAVVPLNYLSVLVGTNDSGKSNILRALNLFFNGETGKGRPFNFAIDHNLQNRPNRRAREIVIRVRMELPDAYVANNGEEIVWEKRWRDTGLEYSGYKGYRTVRNRLGRDVRSEVEISSRSNVHSLLRKIEFVYVPAVRDAGYFDFLRGQIHSVIAEVADESFRASSASFERSIAEHLSGLTADIRAELGIESRLALPRDLSHVFERLDFLADATDLSLDSRGDGIKARHIPLILKFMADQKRSLQTRGAAPISTFWAYEEPENNLEFRHAVGLADELWKFMDDDVAQVLVTSHSPVFYNLMEKNAADEDYVSCVHVYKESDEEGTQVTEELTELDDRMGTTALLAPRLLALEASVRSQEEARFTAERLAAAGRAKIFVEGASDRVFFNKLFNEFAPNFLGVVADIETLDAGAGHSYVGDMLSAWYCTQKHRGGRPRAVGLLDSDQPGNELRLAWNGVQPQVEVCKCFVLPKPAHVIAALQRQVKVAVTLEELYPRHIWEEADAAGHLENRSLSEVLPDDVLNRIVRGEERVSAVLGPEFEIYGLKKFRQDGKAAAAARISRWHSELFLQHFAFLRPFVLEIERYLRP
ncbi:MAG TPA: AAA family ATPase [Lysobacter sp.]